MPNGIPYQNALENRAIVAQTAKAGRFEPDLNPEIRPFTITDKAPRYYIYMNGIQFMSCVHSLKVKTKPKTAQDDEREIWTRHRCIYAQGDKWTYAVRLYYCSRTKNWSDSRHKEKSCAIRTECQGYTTEQVKAILHRWCLNTVVIDNLINSLWDDL